MSVVSTTDYWLQRELGAAAPSLLALGCRSLGDVAGLVARSGLNQELSVRNRRIAQFAHANLTATRRPAWRPTPRPAVKRRADATSDELIANLDPTAPATFTVRFDGDTVKTILANVELARPLDVETGGWLFAWQRLGENGGVVCRACGPPPGSKHSRYEMTIGSVRAARNAEASWTNLDRLEWIGDWHAQPMSGRPSQTDLQAWARAVHGDPRDDSRYLSIIVTPNGALGPKLYGYVTRRDGEPNRYVTEPATLIDEWGDFS